MKKLATRKLLRTVAIALVCLSLWGCGLINPRPPRSVVEAAIAQKLSQTQAILHRQLAPAMPLTDLAQISSLRIADHRWLTLANQPAVEVTGSYRLKGGELTMAQRRQKRAFDLYLQQGNTKASWMLLEPLLDQSGKIIKWQSTPLSTATKGDSAEPD